jgi:uncharacterized membrane protein YdjX (TVP38/TMEM64 family)
MPTLKRFLPLLLIVALLAFAYAMGWHRLLSWQALGAQQTALRARVAADPVLAALAYVGLYTVSTAVSFPGAVVITVAGGLLFGTVLGAVLTVIGATLGGTLLFLAARSAFAPLIARKGGALLDRLRPRLERDGFSYLLALRFLPVFPFWLVNLAAAASGIRLGVFVAATFLGIGPATTVFASIGAGLGTVLAAGGTPDLGLVFSPPVLLPLLGLACLALLPVAVRHWKGANA